VQYTALRTAVIVYPQHAWRERARSSQSGLCHGQGNKAAHNINQLHLSPDGRLQGTALPGDSFGANVALTMGLPNIGRLQIEQDRVRLQVLMPTATGCLVCSHIPLEVKKHLSIRVR
jgi:hypothetical protein